MYIHHWPMHQVLNLTVLAALPTALVVTAGLLVTAPVAAASWFLVERRAMRWKNAKVPARFRRPRDPVTPATPR